MRGEQAPKVIGVLSPSDDADVASLIEGALELRDLGADALELDATEHGAFAATDDDTFVLLAAGLVDVGIDVCVATTRAELAVVAADHGVGTIIDPSGGHADPDMRAALAEIRAAIVIGPWGRPGSASAPVTSADVGDRYAEGILRNSAALLDAGIRSDRIRVHAGAGVSPQDADTWRMLGHLDRLTGLGYPLLISGTDDVLGAMVVDELDEERLDDAATAVAVLAVGAAAWGIRTNRIVRTAAAMHRMLDRAPSR